MREFGKIKINLTELIEESGISKNKLCHRAELQRAQLNNYCNNNVARMDIDVLARICTVMNCQISDILEFIPPDSDEESKESENKEDDKDKEDNKQ